MFDKFWKQFLIEAEETPAIQATNLVGDEAYIDSKGYFVNKKFGKGKDGHVYSVENKANGQRAAMKIVREDAPGSFKREQENYKFVMDNRESFGDYAKYLPVVYSSEIDSIPPKSGSIDDPNKQEAAIILMEPLVPLLDKVKSLLNLRKIKTTIDDPDDPTGTRKLPRPPNEIEDEKKARELRDKRIFNNSKLISNMLTAASKRLDYYGIPSLSQETVDVIVSEFIKFIYSPELENFKQNEEESLLYSKEASKLKQMFFDEVYNKYNDDSLKDKINKSFYYAYQRPITSGGVNLGTTSSLRGFDLKNPDEVAETFPEIVNFANAMQYFFGKGFRAFDVHDENVMMRPDTGDIVIVDLGRFSRFDTSNPPPRFARKKQSLSLAAQSYQPPDGASTHKNDVASTFALEGKRRMAENMKKQVASCIVFDNKDRILIIKRSKTDDWKPGWWDIPGGHMEEGEIPVEGAIRETDEESGLTVRNLVQVETKQFPDIIKHFFATRNYDGEVYLRPNHETGEIEHDEYRWVSIEQLKDIKNSVVPLSIVKKAMHLA